jgi:hypothetical protein
MQKEKARDGRMAHPNKRMSKRERIMFAHNDEATDDSASAAKR